MLRNQDMSKVEELDYKDEDQDWYQPDFPTTDRLTPNQWKPLQQEIDVVMMTATDVELYAVIKYLNPYPQKEKVLQVNHENGETYFLGKFGEFKIVVTKCRMGTVGEGAATLATEKALNTWNPKAIIMVGIAFGKDPNKQKIADVLVASAIIPYENQRIGDEKIFRSPIPPSNTILLNRFENAHGWRFLRPDNTRSQQIFGHILSGEKLVDNSTFKTELFERYPNAAGGEMEGAGLYGAAQSRGTAWILVKSICDWGDGTKSKKYQRLAAAAATSLVHYVLSDKTVLNGIGNILGISYHQPANSDNDELLQILKSESDETQEKIINQYHKYLDSIYWTGEKASSLQQMFAELRRTESNKALEKFLKVLITIGILSSPGSEKISNEYNIIQPPQQHTIQPYLLVKITPNSDKKTTFIVNAWLICDDIREHDKRFTPICVDKEKRYSLKELQREDGIIADIIRDTLDIIASKNILATLKIEFFLSIKDINLSIHQWRINSNFAIETIGIRYPVVIRSHERLSKRYLGLTIVWRNKWNKLKQIQNSEFKQLFVTIAQTDNFDSYLEKELAIEKNIGLKLSCSSFLQDSKLLAKLINRLLSSGTPVAILPINHLPESQVDSLLRNEQQRGIRYLPNFLHEKRMENWDVGQNLVLLWEDPERLTPDVEYNFESPTQYQPA
jgi:nucleoside phosphorylase